MALEYAFSYQNRAKNSKDILTNKKLKSFRPGYMVTGGEGSS